MVNLKDTNQVIKYLSGLKELDSYFDVILGQLVKHDDTLVRFMVADMLPDNLEYRRYVKELAKDSESAVRFRAKRTLYGDDFDLDKLISDTRNLRDEISIKEVVDKSTGIVLGTNVKIMKNQILNGLTFDKTHYALAKNGLYMAGILPIMSLYRQGKIDDCFVWLDAKFSRNRGGFLGLQLETEHRVENGVLTSKRIEPLEECVNESSVFVELDSLNRQGLPTKKSKVQTYSQGNNIRFWKPENGRVARFWANSFGAILSCDGYPAVADAGLGVFGCAEGADAKKLGENENE